MASHVTLTVILPSQLLSAAGMMPPSGPACAGVSMAPGFTFGSQSLQSPWAGVQPSPSMSLLTSTTLQGVPTMPPLPTLPTKVLPPSPPLVRAPAPLPEAPPDPLLEAPLVKVLIPVALHAA